MTIPRNDQLKSALVSRIKANTTITSLLTTSEEVREAQWQGNDFVYPNIRVRVVDNKPSSSNCDFSETQLAVGCFSEQDSSQEADKIAGIIANELHTQSFTSQAIKFSNLKVERIIPAIRIDERTWMSELILNGRTSG